MSLPPEPVLRSWGVSDPSRLSGGQGESHRAGDLVLKPVGDTHRYELSSAALQGLSTAASVRIGLPVRARDGRWVVDGWGATAWLEGEDRLLEPGELLDVSARFHRAVSDVPAAAVVEGSDRWAQADRLAWDIECTVDRPELAALAARRRPIDLPRQLIHGDLAGNVVSDDLLGPGVIDLSPYWRPVPYAEAIVITDLVARGRAWQAVFEEHLRRFGDQLLIRAVIFRVEAEPAHLPLHRPLLDALLS